MSFYDSGRNAMYGGILYIAALLPSAASHNHAHPVPQTGIEQKVGNISPGALPGGMTRDWGALSPQRVYAGKFIPMDYERDLRNPTGFLGLGPYTPLSAFGNGQSSAPAYGGPIQIGAAASVLVPYGAGTSPKGNSAGGVGGKGLGGGSSAGGSGGSSGGLGGGK